MEFNLEVGMNEKHQVHFKRNWFTGKLVILVDSQPVVTKSPLNPATHVSVKLSHKYDFSFGDLEKHTIRIERIRPLLLAGLRPHEYRVFIDENLVSEHKGF